MRGGFYGGNVVAEEKAKEYEIKDLDGEKFKVRANGWECGGNGLKFYMNQKLVAWFAQWANWRKI